MRRFVGAGLLVAALVGCSAPSASSVDDGTPRQSQSYPTNANGQTYGSGDTDGATPTLIEAYGKAGNRGFVYADDLRPSPDRPPIREIPLYENDGLTVIGSFAIN